MPKTKENKTSKTGRKAKPVKTVKAVKAVKEQKILKDLKEPKKAVKKKIAVRGVPAGMTLEIARDWTQPRISKKRFDHVCGVAAVGDLIAKKAGVNRFLVGLACYLHDCCKETKDKELIEHALRGGLTLSAIEAVNGHLLHGPVAALTIKEELKITNKDVLTAISEHTLGSVTMSEISKVVFLADCLEESRPVSFTEPIWAALNTPVGLTNKKVNLDRAMLVACDLSLSGLLESGRPIHPKTVDVRNHFLGIVRTVEKSVNQRM